MMAQRKGKRKKSRRALKARSKRLGSEKAAQPARSKRRDSLSPTRTPRTGTNDGLVVGIGASAGGLEAFKELLTALPADTGMSFVLIQHLDPTHKSMMADLLARDTAMAVKQAGDGMAIERNCLYVIPPQAYLAVRNGVLRLSQPEAHQGVRRPFDFFLNSLADECGERAVCVILSGTGTDGSAGLKAVSEKGGLVIAQDPGEAAYSGMPQSAISTGAVNLVLAAREIPHALTHYAQHPYVTADRRTAPPDEAAGKSLTTLIDLLRSRTAHDFSHYRHPTLLRRIQRRMAAAGAKEIEDYIRIVEKDGRELRLLAKDLLIHVTGFFRDPAVYEALAKTVIPDLVRAHPDDQPIRVWVPGCSTGEEAYSLAMIFFEEFAASKRNLKLQIFASDVSSDAVACGRQGIYPDSIKADISAERLARFFARENHGYQVNRDLRDSIVFTVQDLLTDPPFSHLDLVSCRNLLIYLQPDEQEKVLSLFHFALRDGGFLLLGTAETIGKLTDGFKSVIDVPQAFRRIGRRLPRVAAMAPNIFDRARALWPRVAAPAGSKRTDPGDLARRLLLESFAPATVLVDRKYQGLYFFGPTDRYLRVAPGEPNLDLPAMLRDGLASKFRAAIQQASRDNASVTVGDAQVKRDGSSAMVSIAVRPVRHEGEQLFLVSFTEVPGHKPIQVIETPAEISRVEQLEREVESTRKELESTIRDLEISNQELTSLNEEAVSMNEEFQSTNEELETSREELQSVNEELTTVNSQLQESLDRQRQTGDDLQNILNSSAVATLFLDRNLNIRVFTPAAAPLFNLIATDVGRSLAHLKSRFVGVDLLVDARAVLANLTPIKREARSELNVWYLCTIAPYRTQDDRIEGVVVNFADISDLKAGEENLRAAHAEAIIDTVHQPLIVLDENLTVISASRSFYEFFGASPADTLGRHLAETDGHHLDTPSLGKFLEHVKSGDDGGENYEIVVDLEPRGRRTLLVSAEEIRGAVASGKRILLSFNDVTDSKRAHEQVSAAKRVAELANLAKSRFLAAASHDLRQPLQTLSLLHGTLKRQTKDKEALDLLERAERALDTMSGMLVALLDINQLETGKITPKLSDFPINSLFDGLKTDFTGHASSKGLRLRIVPCGLTIRSDRHFLDEMIRNLLTNAIRYTDKGTILLGVRRFSDRLRVEVWDTGLGIAEGQIPRIFQEYHQVREQGERGGLGLGLAIVQRLGELLGHPVGVRSQVGKGSVFSVEVPIVRSMPRRTGQSRAAGHKGASRLATVLIVEDEGTVRGSLESMFKNEGHHVIATPSGEGALAFITHDRVRPDLVICDYGLPGAMNGVQTAKTLRAALNSQVPVIVLTGDVRASTLNDIAGEDFTALKKPVKPAVLSQTVQQLLEASGPPQPGSAITSPATSPRTDANSAIFIVDDDHDVRDAMKRLLTEAGYRVNTYPNAKAFLDSPRGGEKGCLVVDVRMPGMTGFELLARLEAEGEALPAIVITGQGDIPAAVQAMRAGAVDFIEKPIDPAALLTCVRRALQQAASPTERSAWRKAAAMRVAGLTRREREVMDLVVAGHANKEIAARLGISQRTVETHRAAVMKKTDASSLSDLVRLESAARGGVQ